MPSLPYLASLKTSKVSESTASTNGHDSSPDPASSIASSPSKSRQIQRNSFNDPEVDPWASTAVQKNQTQHIQNEATPGGANTAARPIVANHTTRTTSTFTTGATDTDSTSKMTGTTLGDNAPGNTTGAWGGLGNTGFSASNAGGLGGAGFGSGGDEQPNSRLSRPFGGSRSTPGRPVEETVTITLLPEKEGMFMFQHRNYEVKSARRASSVVRRYSDFVWLLDCLHKRYPFRQLPLLPPKRVAGKY